MSTIQSGLADVGKAQSTIGFVVGTITFIIFLIAGLYLIFTPEPVDNKKNKTKDINVLNISRPAFGIIFICIGFVLFLFTYFYKYMNFNYEGYAAYNGVDTSSRLVKSIFF